MRVRFQMSKGQWRKIKRLLPGKETDPGYTAYDNRLFLEALIYMAREGCRWRAIPEAFGPWYTVYTRFYRWQEQGVFDLLAQVFIAKYKVHMLIVDGTIISVHHDGTGARRALGTPEDQAIGNSRGGRTTKLLAACYEDGSICALSLLPGNAGESNNVESLIEEIESKWFMGDKAYDSDKLITWLKDRHTNANVPPRRNRIDQRYYDKEMYKERNLIERAFERIKRYRRISTRYDKTVRSFRSFLIVTLVHILTKTAASVLREVYVDRPLPIIPDGIELYVPEGEERRARAVLNKHPDGFARVDARDDTANP